MIKVVIIILNWNGKDNTIQCLESIEQLRTENLELRIIVVDNGSTDGSAKAIQNAKFKMQNYNAKLKIIRNEKNLGFAGGNNVGIRYALEGGADYVLILNNDTIVDTHLVETMVKTAQKDEHIGIVGPKIYFAKGFEFHKDRYKRDELGRVIWYAGGIMDWANVIGHHRGVDEVDHGQYDRQGETDFASGCCLLVKKEVFEKVGLLDDKYFLYYEDSDLSKRAKQKGFKIVYIPKAFLWHKNAGSGGGSGSSLQDYYITRNRLLFGMRYAPTKAKIALVRESIALLFGGRPWQKKGVFDFYTTRFGKGRFPDEI